MTWFHVVLWGAVAYGAICVLHVLVMTVASSVQGRLSARVEKRSRT